MTRPRAFVLVFAFAAAACRHTSEQFLWVDALPEEPPAPEYVVARGDVLSIRVWNQDGLTGRARVRSDGHISLPFVNDVEAAGIAPSVLARHLEARLKEFIVNPVVVVAVEEERRVLQVSVVGEVPRPGMYQLEPGSGVLQALAIAGGPTEYAKRDRIYVLRHDLSGARKAPDRVRFRYDALTRGEGRAATFTLREGDVVVVE